MKFISIVLLCITPLLTKGQIQISKSLTSDNEDLGVMLQASTTITSFHLNSVYSSYTSAFSIGISQSVIRSLTQRSTESKTYNYFTGLHIGYNLGNYKKTKNWFQVKASIYIQNALNNPKLHFAFRLEKSIYQKLYIAIGSGTLHTLTIGVQIQ